MVTLNYAGIQAAIYNAVSGRSVRYAIHPALAGDGVPGVKLTSGAGVWGAQADIVAAAAIAADFFICGVQVRAAEAAQVFEIQVSDATPNVLVEGIIDITAVTVNMNPVPVPYPVYMVGGAQVQGRAGGIAAKNIYAAILYATLL